MPLPDKQQPQTHTSHYMADGRLRTDWVVDARKLDGSDQQVVSPAFWLDRQETGARIRFKMLLNPKKIIAGRRVSCFKKALGRGYISLKCEGDHEGNMGGSPLVVNLQVVIGRRHCGVVCHDFSRRALFTHNEEWDFRSVVDATSQTFVVSLLLTEAWDSLLGRASPAQSPSHEAGSNVGTAARAPQQARPGGALTRTSHARGAGPASSCG